MYLFGFFETGCAGIVRKLPCKAVVMMVNGFWALNYGFFWVQQWRLNWRRERFRFGGHYTYRVEKGKYGVHNDCYKCWETDKHDGDWSVASTIAMIYI